MGRYRDEAEVCYCFGWGGELVVIHCEGLKGVQIFKDSKTAPYGVGQRDLKTSTLKWTLEKCFTDTQVLHSISITAPQSFFTTSKPCFSTPYLWKTCQASEPLITPKVSFGGNTSTASCQRRSTKPLPVNIVWRRSTLMPTCISKPML